jgi:hypothetical protein
MSASDHLLKMKDFSEAYKLWTVATLTLLIFRLGDDYLPRFTGGFPENWIIQAGSSLMVFMTILAFAIGDRGPTNIMQSFFKNPGNNRNSAKMERCIGIQVILLAVHILIIPLMAWFACSHHQIVISLMLALAAANMIWIGVTMLQFGEFKLEFRVRSTMWMLITKCEVAMIKWTILNGVFFAAVSSVFAILGQSPMAYEIGIWMALLRTSLDFYICRKYYTDVIRGSFSIKAMGKALNRSRI